MRHTIGGNGTDTTAALTAYLQANASMWLAHLFLIGPKEDPLSLWLTDWDTPLKWGPQGTFVSDVISRGQVSSKVGLEVSSLEVKWSPQIGAFTGVLSTTSPYQQARLGYFANKEIKVWKAFMPTPGDCYTFGACPLFGGRIGEIQAQRNLITFTVQSFLDQINQPVPTNVIELTNTLAQYSGATPPTGHSSVPQFNVIAGSNPSTLYLQETYPNANNIFSDNTLRPGFLVFNSGGASTLGGIFRTVEGNTHITLSGTNYNEVFLYQPLPWAPTPGVDTCWFSRQFPLDQSEGDYLGFPYVPAPTAAV